MSALIELFMAALKRLGRYFLGRPRFVFKYPFQEADSVDCYSDTDWAGCPKTRKSTSGGGDIAWPAYLENVFVYTAYN